MPSPAPISVKSPSRLDTALEAARRYESVVRASSPVADSSNASDMMTVPVSWTRVNRKRYPRFPTVPLPAAGLATLTVSETLAARRSVRTALKPIAVEDISAILGEAIRARPENPLSRPYPSAGARNATELYALVSTEGVTGLQGGTYHYDPHRHSLDVLDTLDVQDTIQKLTVAQLTDAPPLLLVFSIILHRTCVKYGGRGLRFAYLEAGAAAMAADLSATARSLGCCWLGGFDDHALSAAIDVSLDLDLETPVLCLAVGSIPVP